MNTCHICGNEVDQAGLHTVVIVEEDTDGVLQPTGQEYQEYADCEQTELTSAADELPAFLKTLLDWHLAEVKYQFESTELEPLDEDGNPF